MGDTFGMHRVNETEIIDMLRDPRKKRRDVAPALPVLREFPERLHDPLRGGRFVTRVGNLPCVEKINFLSIAIKEQGLVIEGIDVARTTLHKNKNDPLRPRRKNWETRSEGITGESVRESGKGKSSEAAGGGLKKVTAIHLLFKVSEINGGKKRLEKGCPGLLLFSGGSGR